MLTNCIMTNLIICENLVLLSFCVQQIIRILLAFPDFPTYSEIVLFTKVPSMTFFLQTKCKKGCSIINNMSLKFIIKIKVFGTMSTVCFSGPTQSFLSLSINGLILVINTQAPTLAPAHAPAPEPTPAPAPAPAPTPVPAPIPFFLFLFFSCCHIYFYLCSCHCCNFCHGLCRRLKAMALVTPLSKTYN